MAIKKAKIANTIFDVITYEEYLKNPEFYKQQCAAVDGDDGILYPIRTNASDFRAGFYDVGAMTFFKPPMDSEVETYSSQNIIDFSKAGCIRDIIKSQNELANAERAILTTIDNVFVPQANANDTPEMGLLKEAIVCKHVDLDKYENRFGPNYNNDKRLIKKNNITFGKLRNICNALDIRVTLTMEDNDPSVANPMTQKISACLTDGFANPEEDGVE